MNQQTATDLDLDQTDEDILTDAVSDEALEAAAGAEGGGVYSDHRPCSFSASGC